MTVILKHCPIHESLQRYIWYSTVIILYVLGVKLIANRTSENRISVGSVQVYENGNWKSICDNNWTKADSDVACKDIGFIGAIENLSVPYDHKEHKTLLKKDYMCTGKEDFFITCPSKHRDTTSDCPNIAAIRCKDAGICIIY